MQMFVGWRPWRRAAGRARGLRRCEPSSRAPGAQA